jgi:hypothetical protein
MTTIENLTAASFSGVVNTRFRLNLPETDVLELELIKVEDIGSTGKQERFSLLFQGPPDRGVQQGSYSFEHEELGKFELFIVPISRKEEGFVYEAAFNRIKKGSAI